MSCVLGIVAERQPVPACLPCFPEHSMGSLRVSWVLKGLQGLQHISLPVLCLCCALGAWKAGSVK